MAELGIEALNDRHVAEPSAQQSAAAAARVRRFRDRFLYCWSHPLWTKWRKEAKEDLEFTSGIGQWDKDTEEALKAQKLACLTINQVRPVVSVVVGYERSTRMDIKVVPEGQEDLESANLLNRLTKKVQQDEEVPFVLSDAFKEGIIGGLAAIYIGTDYTEDPIHGKVDVQQPRPGEVVWDPEWRRYDLRDAKDLFWHKMVAVDALKAQYPDSASAIEEAASIARAATDATKTELPSRDPADAYKRGIEDSLTFFDPQRDEVRVLECWYTDWEPAYILVDKAINTVQEIPNDPEAVQIARAMAKENPNANLITRKRRVVKMSVVVPDLGLELEHGNPFENDTGDYPFVPYVAYREGDEIFGMVRNLKDPQREVNKIRSVMADNATLHGRIKTIAERGMFENPEFLENSGQGGNVGWVRKRDGMFKELNPPEMPAWVPNHAQVAKLEIRESSGINADLLGVKDTDSSGIAIARRQQQGQIITAELFDNLRRTRRIVAKRLCKRIQQIYTDDRVIRLTGEAGSPEWVRINANVPHIDPKTGKETVNRTIPDLAFDVEMTDTPSTPTVRAQSLGVLMDLLQKWPALAPALTESIIEMTDIPDREKILAKIRAMMQPPTQQPGGGAPAIPPANPSPVPSATGAAA